MLSLLIFTRKSIINTVWVLACCVLYLPIIASNVNADQETGDLSVSVFITNESSLTELLEGKPGEAYLVYFLLNKGLEQPSIVVHLKKSSEMGNSVAKIFDAPEGTNFVPLEFVDDFPVLPNDLHPKVIITAPDGWWKRDGLVNYNLDIEVLGPVVAMWGATTTNWPLLLEQTQSNSRIIVRDTNRNGLPDWDWRTMLPEFPNRGDLRSTYAERKCNTLVDIEMGVFPEWPFIATQGGFEQPTGIFRPPIVVDWKTGKVKYFSEMVTVRNQNCSYSIYSINRVLEGQMNSPNFETPFAFYDLSGKGTGYPNLILRSGRSIIDTDALGLATDQMEVIRYSWSNEEVGDGSMDYKVEVFGFHPFEYTTTIADGRVLIDAPPYEVFPKWVIDKAWPVVTFIDTEDINYRTSEGVYEWAPGDLGYEYYLGQTEQVNAELLADIRVGLRGEYRLESNHQSELYLSPIDNRLHLKWAEHGIWRLDESQIIRVSNLDNDETIDVWSREKIAITRDENDEVRDLSNTTTQVKPEIAETLYALDGYLLHNGNSRVTLIANEYDPMLFETLPPTDHDTWKAHRAQLTPYEDQRRDPTNLHAWLDAFPGSRSEITRTSLSSVRIIDDGFRFELSLEPSYQIIGSDILGLSGLAPGDYTIENSGGAFTVEPLIPAQLSLDIQQLAESGEVTTVQVSIHNAGTADAPDLTLVAETVDKDGTVTELTRELVEALAGETEQLLVDIPSPAAGTATLRVRLEDADGQIVAEADPTGLTAPPLNRNVVFSIWQVPVLVPVLALFGAFAAGAAVLAVARRRGQTTV